MIEVYGGKGSSDQTTIQLPDGTSFVLVRSHDKNELQRLKASQKESTEMIRCISLSQSHTFFL